MAERRRQTERWRERERESVTPLQMTTCRLYGGVRACLCVCMSVREPVLPTLHTAAVDWVNDADSSGRSAERRGQRERELYE